ncbi:hypothetical protein HC891_21960, partial [Candidatus Gracilibacteria bacterium]|nr:hypothetical protein [Candidatus Gracilibacteria bacterium]
YATQNRQDAVKFMAPRADVVIVVGSPNSSNSNRLREVPRRWASRPTWWTTPTSSIRRGSRARARRPRGCSSCACR